MYRLIQPYFCHNDTRGALRGIVNFGVWQELNYISSSADMVRGNHYHRETEELFFVLQGRIRVTVQRVEHGRLAGIMEEFIVSEGSIFMVETMVNHVFHVLEDAQWINMLSKPINPECPDIYRVAG
jgi:dTDP-4-dehydrorhamnose 3,5-epimerase-like enzyme